MNIAARRTAPATRRAVNDPYAGAKAAIAIVLPYLLVVYIIRPRTDVGVIRIILTIFVVFL